MITIIFVIFLQIYVFSLNITKVYRIIMTSTLFFTLPETKEAKQDSHELTLYMIATPAL